MLRQQMLSQMSYFAYLAFVMLPNCLVKKFAGLVAVLVLLMRYYRTLLLYIICGMVRVREKGWHSRKRGTQAI